MPVPDYQTIMLPLLKYCAAVPETNYSAAEEALASEFGLTDRDLAERLPSGLQTVFHNRVGWARTYLAKAMLLDSPKRGVFRITPRGREYLAKGPKFIGNNELMQFPEFVAFRERKSAPTDDVPPTKRGKRESAGEDDYYRETPDDTIARGYRQHRENIVAELMDRLSQMHPAKFEQLVLDVLLAMGYGGSNTGAAKGSSADFARVTGKSGDGGIDGVIDEDRLGLDVIYVQAKRWEGVVGRPEIQKFAGALQGHRAKKGVFFTTSEFSRDAHDYVKLVDSRIVLIDGRRLANLMIDYSVGVTESGRYVTNRIDSDYFEE